MTFKARLKQILRERNVTPDDLSVQLKYSRSNISKWMNGRLPTTQTLMELCEFLDVSADWLLWGDAKSSKSAQSTGTPQWETVDTTFSMASGSFGDFIDSAQSLFFTSVWLTRAFDASNPALHQLVQSGCKMRFVFPQLDITLKNFYDTNGKETLEQSERKKLNILSSLYLIKEWGRGCSVELRLSLARPVNNVLAVDYHLETGKILYIPYLFGDFEMGMRPGYVIEREKHPDWYATFYQRYIVTMWEDALAVDDIDSLIEAVKDYR